MRAMLRASILCLCALALAYNLATAQSALPGVPLFPYCDKPELLAHGRPVMMFVKPRLGMGISIAKDTFEAGTPDTLNVWGDNQSDAAVSVYTCSFVGLFLLRGFDIWMEMVTAF